MNKVKKSPFDVYLTERRRLKNEEKVRSLEPENKRLKARNTELVRENQRLREQNTTLTRLLEQGLREKGVGTQLSVTA